MMSALALSDIALAVGGHLEGDARFDHVCTDTRTLQAGDLFVALVGDNFDANSFVAQAANSGAVAAVVSRRPELSSSENSPEKSNPEQSIPHLLVGDTRVALGCIARSNRRQFTGPVIALTGSAGKTTCKEMIASILAECGLVLSTRGNLNNEIGVPLTLLEISQEHQYAVIEMGASRAGDIEYLAQFVEPDVALVTNAMPVHVASFGGIETIAQTKGEIFKSLAVDGIAVINLDDPHASQWQQQAAGRRVFHFSKDNSQAEVYARNIQLHSSGETSFTLCSVDGEVEIQLALLGEHNIQNALAASASAIAADATLDQVKCGLAKVRPVAGRLKSICLPGLRVIDDSYNASPGSVKAAIDVLVSFSGRRCLLLGTMGELGAEAERLHREVASYARDKGVEQFIVVGEFAEMMAQVFGPPASSFKTMDNLLAVLNKQLCADVVLVKGSRFTRMERVVDTLVKRPENNRGER
ncbi:MAG: UDP-N-acetylmuramoyl-tripeptide--D-alanyl-D-alanine ligase [Pseudomonadales bacterium]